MTSGRSSTAREAAESLRHSLRLVVLGWIFGSVWLHLTSGAVLTRYAQWMEMPKFAFGLMAGLISAASLIQLPASYFLERYGHRKVFFILSGCIHRLLWAVIGLIPWVLPQVYWWTGLVVMLFATSLLGQMAGPGWVSWMADLVPPGIRGRYFSRRTQIGQMVGLVVTMAAGWLLDWRAGDGVGMRLPRMISALLIIGSVFGVADFLCFTRVPAVERRRPDPEVNLWRLIRQPLQDRSFRLFLCYVGSLTFSVTFTGPYIWLYLFDVAHVSNMQANLLVVVGPMVAGMLAFPLWGRLLDRFGRRPVLKIALIMVLHGAVPWMFMTREHWVGPFLVAMLASFAWPGVELANFNMLLGMSESLGSRRYGSACAALQSVTVAVMGFLSGLFGGWLAEALSRWHGDLLGWPLTYHGVMFWLSMLLRMIPLALAHRLEDRGAGSTREALRYAGQLVFVGLQQVVLPPVRLFARAGRWTYKLRAGRQRLGR